jgi:tetratricopeptide (TPR) repeat protein
VDIARAISDSARLADAALALHRDRTSRESIFVDEPMIALLEQALDATDSRDLGRRALLVSALAQELQWLHQERGRRIELGDAALDLARRSGDDQVLIRTLGEQGYGYDFEVPYAHRIIAGAVEMVALATRVDDPALLVAAYSQRMFGSLMLGDRATYDADLEAMEASTAQLRQRRPEFDVGVGRAAQALLSGRLDAAEQRIASLGDFAVSHHFSNQSTVAWTSALTFQLYYERGRLAELESLMEQFVIEQPATVIWRAALLSVYAATDRLDDAREHLHTLAANDFALVPRDILWNVSMTGVARIAGLAGELEIAERAYDYMLPFRGTVIVAAGIARGPVALTLGTAAAALGRFEDAEQLFTESIDLAERLEAPTFVAETRVRWAETLLDPHGPHDVPRAKDLARQALATAEELGLGRTAELSRRVLG